MSEPGGARGPVDEVRMLTIALVRNRALAIRRDWTSRSLYGFALFLGLGVFFFIFTATFAGVRVLESAAAFGLLQSIPAWAFLVYLFTDVLIAFGQALGDLYLSRDMPILMAMPLRIPSIIFAKFTVGVAQNQVYVAIFLLPFALGYLAGVGAPLWTLAVAAGLVFVFPATLYAAMIVLTIIALRFIPPKLAKEGLWLVGASVPTLFWFLSFYKIAHVAGDIATMRLPSPPDWLPSTWIGNAVAMLGEGNHAAAVWWIALMMVATFAACPAALVIVSRSFEKGWSAAIAVPGRRNIGAGAVAKKSAPVFALAWKDLKTFARAPQLWFNHIAALGFVGYLIVGHSVQTPLLPLTIQLVMTQVGFVAVLGALNPGMTALSLEHLSVWVLKSMPLPPGDILAAKFSMAYVQTGTIGALSAAALAYGYGLPVSAAVTLVAFALTASASAVCVGIAFDAAYPSFNWDNPNHINRGLRMIVPFFINLGVLLASAIMLFVFRAAAPPTIAVGGGLSTSMILFGIVAYVALRRANRDLAALEV